MKNLIKKYSVTVFGALLATGIVLTGCGGGGTTAGVGGGGTSAGGASSTVVLSVPNYAAAEWRLRGASTSLLSGLSDIVMPQAQAQTESDVYMDGVMVATLDATGMAMFEATAGEHLICIGAASEAEGGECLEPLIVEPDTIVKVTITEDFSQDPIVYSVSVEPVADDVVDNVDENLPHKRILCHKGKVTISVGAPAEQAHLAHGDTQGPCVDSEETTTNNRGRGRGNPNA